MDSQIYEPRIMAFVDILGFKNMVLGSADNLREQQRILRAMEIIHGMKQLNDSGPDGGMRRYGVYVTTFSDSAIISYPLLHDGGLFYVLMDLIHLQIDLLAMGIFIRGGITIGLAHHNDVNAFGPAMVEAYCLESKKAVYPRMILTEETLLQGVIYSPSHQNQYDVNLLFSLVRRDNDGYYFLNYLTQSQEFDYPETDYYLWLQGVRNAIIFNLNASYGNPDKEVQRIFEKYYWMLNYWNAVLGSKNFTCPVDENLSEEETKDIIDAYMRLKIDPSIIPFR